MRPYTTTYEKFKEEYERVNRVYYRIYQSTHTELMTIVCMQWFDEYDYEDTRFIREDGEKLEFDDENKAIAYLNAHYRKEDIEPEYYRIQPILRSE